MVDPGENINVTLKREFGEEAMNTLEMGSEQREKVIKQVDELFSQGQEVSLSCWLSLYIRLLRCMTSLL